MKNTQNALSSRALMQLERSVFSRNVPAVAYMSLKISSANSTIKVKSIKFVQNYEGVILLQFTLGTQFKIDFHHF